MKASFMLYLIKTKCEDEKFAPVFVMLTPYYKSYFNYLSTSSIMAKLVPNCKYLSLIMYLFRGRRSSRTDKNPLVAFDCRNLMTRAARIMMEARRSPSSEEMQILIRRDPINPWRASGQLEKASLMSWYVNHRPVMGRGRDKSVMMTFMKKVNQAGIQIPVGTKFEEFLPAGAPILDFLAVSMEKMECWQFPTKPEIRKFQQNRGLSYSMLQEVEVKEIVVGETSSDHCREIISWFWSNYEKDQKLLPTAVCSMDNEEIRISLLDVYRMAGRVRTDYPRRISDVLVDHDLAEIPEDRWLQLPVRVMVGNGISYALMITIVLDRDSRNEYLLNRVRVQEEVISFFEEMPVSTGLGVKTDVSDLEFYYSLFTGKTVSCKGFLDLSALAVLAGYNMRAMSMTPMGVNISGHTLNKCVSTGDGKWSWRWEELSDPLKLYCLGDLKFGHMTYSILAAVLIRDVFPDPDILCKFLGVASQFRAVTWILELIMLSLEGVEIHNADFDDARSRSEMIKSLRFRYSYDSPLMETSPTRVLIWCEILGDWPALTKGGCRFLSQAREWFLTQARVIKSSGFKWTCGVKLKELNPYFISYARFGISPHIIHAAEYWEPVQAYTGLFRPNSLKSTLCNIDPISVKPATLSKFAKKEKKVIKAVLFEWARYYPNQIQTFLQRMKDDLSFRQYLLGVYKGLRIIYKRIYCVDAVSIPELDEQFSMNLKKQLQVEELRLDKTRELFRAREARCAHITAVLQEKDQDDQTLWSYEIPRLPDWIHRRNGRKRVRSVSRSKSRSRSKRCKVDHNNPDQSNRVRDQGDPCSSSSKDQEVHQVQDEEGEMVVIIEDDGLEDDEFGFLGINDPKPVCRKKIEMKRKKNKKKKKSGAVKDTRTYDEIIEAGQYLNSDDEFGLEFDFSGHIL